MDISTDGTALYVVNYKSHTMSKVRTRDPRILQEFGMTPRPIGITYDPFNNEVWVSTYSGTIHVYAESEEGPAGVQRTRDRWHQAGLANRSPIRLQPPSVPVVYRKLQLPRPS